MGFTNYLTQPKTKYDKWFFNDECNQIGFKHYSLKEVGSALPALYSKPDFKSPELNIIRIELEGQSFELPISLAHIANVIKESKEILELEEGWDGFDAQIISKETWTKAITLLVNYSKNILDNFQTIILAPEINPCRDSSIDLVWRTHKARFLLNVKPVNSSPIVASYYGDLYDNKQPIKSNLLDETVIEHLAFWMKNLS